MGFKAPRGAGFLTNPKKALYNRVYNRTTVSADSLLKTERSPGAAPSEFEGGETLSKIFVGYGLAVAITVGFLMWLGLSFKWTVLLMVGVGIVAIFGEQGGAVVILGLAMFFGWLFG